MLYRSEQHSPSYFPPILGNGDLTFPVDCEGAVNLTAASITNVEGFENVIYRAGRRQHVGHDRNPGKILSFGKLWFDAGSSVQSFEQELKEQEGLISSICTYENGVRLLTECFIHPYHPLYCVRKTALKGSVSASWRYQLCGYDADSEEAILSTSVQSCEHGANLSFVMNGQDLYKGQLCIQSETASAVNCADRELSLSFELKENESSSMFLYLEDNLFSDDPAASNAAMAAEINAKGFEGLLAETSDSWKAYFARSYVRTSDEKLNQLYNMALYHLRCYTTRWSIPVGLNNLHWHGKFFAFDEYYSYLGLLGANQLELAKRVPTFRLDVCLPKAIARQTSQTEEQARFVWETSEYGQELAPVGYWNDHIFHMSVIAVGAYEFYEYSQDKEFLSRCYRLIRACAKFFSLHMIEQDGEHAYISKCTDLERLGASVHNPFMTSCGAIRTLQVAAEAARILGIDEEYRLECIELAKKLKASLPVENGMYVPHLNCKQKSVAVFSGKFPFNVLDDDDPKMLAAWYDFLENGAAYGNMYKTGSKLSPWYACWEAEGFARAHRGEEAYERLQKSYDSVGVFGEMFEINEPARRLRPWFTTASGIYLSAVNEMLVESDGETIRLLPACPLKNVSLRLAVKGGAVLEAEVKEGQLISARLISDTAKQMKLVYRDRETLLNS